MDASERIGESVARAMGTDVLEGPMGKTRRRRKVAEPPVHENPRDELKRLVKEHRALVHRARAFEASVSDRTVQYGENKGTLILSGVPEDARVEVLAVVESFRKRADLLEAKMTRLLKSIPIYKHFLSQVFGIGPVVAAYLVAEIDIHKATKISNLRRYCGLAIIDGRLERPRAGVKLAYNAELRTRLYQAFSSMWKNAAKKTKAAPNGQTSKYLTIWTDYKHRMQHSERYNATKNRLTNYDGEGERQGAKAIIHATGWHKAADIFIEDLYIVWRTLEGLPVWPSFWAAKLGYEHGGVPVDNVPRMYTLDEALAKVGNVGGVPSAVVLPTEPSEG